MKVKALKKYAFSDASSAIQNVGPGMILDVPDDIARKWIEMGWAEEVE